MTCLANYACNLSRFCLRVENVLEIDILEICEGSCDILHGHFGREEQREMG